MLSVFQSFVKLFNFYIWGTPVLLSIVRPPELLFSRLAFNLTRSFEHPAKEREQETGSQYETERPKDKGCGKTHI